MNIGTTSDAKLPNRSNEIIIAVPPVAKSKERKNTNAKRTQIISFEESDEFSTASALPSSSPRLMSTTEDSNSDSQPEQSNSSFDSPKSVEVDYVEPESPTPVQILPPATALKYQISNIFDFKDFESSMLKTADSSSSSVASTTTATNSSVSIQQQESVTNSLHSSTTSINRAPVPVEVVAVEALVDEETPEETAFVETERLSAKRIHELEQRCTQLEELVTALQL